MSKPVAIKHLMHGVWYQSAGPTYSVSRLVEELTAMGDDAEIVSVGKAPEDWSFRAPLTNFVPRGLAGSLGISSEFVRYLRAQEGPAVFHGHAIWRPTNLFPLFVPRTPELKLVCSPRGSMTRWSMTYKRYRKAPFWHLLQKPALNRIDAFHVTSDEEEADLRELGFRQPTFKIPNGVDVPEQVHRDPGAAPYVLFLSRIDPKKGLDLLLPAWRHLESRFADWRLKVAGPLDNEYAHGIVSRARAEGLDSVEFTDAVYGDEKQKLLSNAALFVLPSYSENFGIVVAEALAHGVPVITTDTTPWLDLEARGCGLTIEPDGTQLVSAMSALMDRSADERQRMGANGRRWMQTDYGWQAIAREFQSMYAQLSGRG